MPGVLDNIPMELNVYFFDIVDIRAHAHHGIEPPPLMVARNSMSHNRVVALWAQKSGGI